MRIANRNHSDLASSHTRMVKNDLIFNPLQSLIQGGWPAGRAGRTQTGGTDTQTGFLSSLYKRFSLTEYDGRNKAGEPWHPVRTQCLSHTCVRHTPHVHSVSHIANVCNRPICTLLGVQARVQSRFSAFIDALSNYHPCFGAKIRD